MPNLNLPTKFIALLLLFLLLSFGAHLGILSLMNLPLFGNLIVLSYVVNAILAAVIFLLLYKFREKLKNQIGFLFMGGSLLKFVFSSYFFIHVQE